MKRKTKKMSVVDDEVIETSPTGLKIEKKRVICGIYKITNTINGKIYIGQSVDINARWNVHKNKCKFVKYNSHFYSAIRRYGIDNFVFEIVAECPTSCLDILETVYIKELKSQTPNGYNILSGGSRRKDDYKHTNETKTKISKAHKGRKHSEEAKKNMSKAKKNQSLYTRTLNAFSKLGTGNPMFGKLGTFNHRSKEIVDDNGIHYVSRIELVTKLDISQPTCSKRIKLGIYNYVN